MRKSVPKYVRHKARNCGKVTVNGKVHYLPGEFNSEESKAAYGRLIAESLTNPNVPEMANVTLRFLSVAYMKHCQEYYVDEDGNELNEVRQIRLSLRPLLDMFGREPVSSFGPRKLKLVRERIIATGITRGVINERIGRIIRMLSWGAAEEYVPPSIVHACRELRNLQNGRCGDIPEQKEVRPVTLEQVEAVRGYLTSVLRGMVDIELLTGMRPQEVRNMTWGQIDRTDPDAWCYVPKRHKTKRRGKQRRIYIGPEGQRVLGQFLKADSDAYIFSPRDSEVERRATMRKKRTSPLTPSQKARDAKPKTRLLADQYNKDSYRRAIIRACERAFEMPDNLRKIDRKLPAKEQTKLRAEAKAWRTLYCWTPNQLRHACGTLLRKEVGLDGARTVLGHTDKTTTEVYAEQDFERARSIMAKLG